MKYPISEGKYYKIVGATDGTVTDASGNVIASYTAGEEVTFAAPAGDYVNINPSGNILSNYATTAQLSNYATTAQLSNYATIAYVDEAIAAGGGGGSFDMAAYNAFYGKYYTCTTVNEVSTINSDYKNDLTSWGEWIYRLSNLTSGEYMFENCTGLTTFSVDLPKLTSGRWMFRNCTNLTEWNIPLPNLTNGNSMFGWCSKFTSFSVDLSKMTNGKQMFQGCTNLISFTSDLSKMTNGESMFFNCPNLTSFTSDLSSLTSGRSMFGSGASNCSKLDLASVQNIANTINTVSSGTINIGISSSIQGNADLATALEAIRAKGWTVTEHYKS